MSITRLHHTDNLKRVLEAREQKAAADGKNAEETRILAASADRHVREMEKKLDNWERMLLDTDATVTLVQDNLNVHQTMTQEWLRSMDSLVQRVNDLEIVFDRIREQQERFNEVIAVITEDHQKIDEVLASLHTGFTPRPSEPNTPKPALQVKARVITK